MSCGTQMTLTTHPEGKKGFQMYVDGVLAGETVPNGTYIGERCSMAVMNSSNRHSMNILFKCT